MPSLNVYIQAKITDTKTKALIRQLPRARANTLLQQFINGLFVQMTQGNIVTTQIGGTTHTLNPHALNCRINATLDEDDLGTVIGTGANPVTITDYKLQTQVTTNISYSAQVTSIEAPDASTRQVSTTRVFVNNTGATLEIKEVGLYAVFISPASDHHYCIDRTLYPVDVANGATITLTYTITTTI